MWNGFFISVARQTLYTYLKLIHRFFFGTEEKVNELHLTKLL